MRVEVEFESNESGRISVSLESEKTSNATHLIENAVNTVTNEINRVHSQSFGG